MPRQARQILEGSYYHILTRGNDRKRIFRASKDFSYFLKLTRETLDKHPVEIYHYCLMHNHIHFLIRSMQIEDFPKFFQILFQRYASYYRKRYRHTGYLFQNRYKSIPIEKDSYLLECARYIERNPIRAGIENDPSVYEWTSYSYYASGLRNDIIKLPDPLYLCLSDKQDERERRYREYITEDRPYEHIIDKGLRV